MSELSDILAVSLQHSYSNHSKWFRIMFILLISHKLRIKTVVLIVQKSYLKWINWFIY